MKQEVVQIKAPKIERIVVRIVGTAPYVQLRFSQKAIAKMAETQAAGSTAKTKKAREARDFDEDYRQAMHRSTEGWCGIPVGAFRQAMISACRLVGFKMTLAKLSVFVEADGVDEIDGTPLVRLEGEPERVIHHVRNATGVADLRVRAQWRTWAADLRIAYDADQFTQQDVVNLLARAGLQVGIGEGRPDSKNSSGVGWGTFEIAPEVANG